MKTKIFFFLAINLFFSHCFGCKDVFVRAEPTFTESSGAAAIQAVPNANLFAFIFGMPFDAFREMMSLNSEGSKDPLLVLSTDHVFDVRSRRFFLTTSTGNYGCGRCELLSHHELAALNRLRFERFLRGGLSWRAGHFYVVEAVGIDESSPFWHRVDVAALMAHQSNRGAVFQVFECDDIVSLSPSCMATLPACMYRRFFNESRPAARSLLYQHGAQVIYGQCVDGGLVCVREPNQLVDLAVCRAFDPADEHLADCVAATYQAVLQSAFVKEKRRLFLVVPTNVSCALVAPALMALINLIKDSNVEVTLVWHNNGDAEDEKARSALADLVTATDGTYTQYRLDGMYQLRCDSSPASPVTPMTPAVRDALRHRRLGPPPGGADR